MKAVFFSSEKISETSQDNSCLCRRNRAKWHNRDGRFTRQAPRCAHQHSDRNKISLQSLWLTGCRLWSRRFREEEASYFNSQFSYLSQTKKARKREVRSHLAGISRFCLEQMVGYRCTTTSRSWFDLRDISSQSSKTHEIPTARFEIKSNLGGSSFHEEFHRPSI